MSLPRESVFIKGLDANQTMEIVRELRAQGLVQGKNFEFRYQPRQDDGFSYDELVPQGAEFYFYEGKWRTYVTLKYGT